MPLITDVRSIAASTRVDNVLDGKTHEFLRVNSSVQLEMTSSVEDCFITFFTGNDLHIDAQEISQANRFPIIPDDVVIVVAGRAADRIVLTVDNRNALANVVRTKVTHNPL